MSARNCSRAPSRRFDNDDDPCAQPISPLSSSSSPPPKPPTGERTAIIKPLVIIADNNKQTVNQTELHRGTSAASGRTASITESDNSSCPDDNSSSSRSFCDATTTTTNSNNNNDESIANTDNSTNSVPHHHYHQVAKDNLDDYSKKNNNKNNNKKNDKKVSNVEANGTTLAPLSTTNEKDKIIKDQVRQPTKVVKETNIKADAAIPTTASNTRDDIMKSQSRQSIDSAVPMPAMPSYTSHSKDEEKGIAKLNNAHDVTLIGNDKSSSFDDPISQEEDKAIPPELAGIEDDDEGEGDDKQIPTVDGEDENNLLGGDDENDPNAGMIDYESGDADGNGLAVAVAIREEDDDNFYEDIQLLPNAVEYDPDSKPPIYKNRKCRFYSIVGVLFFIILVSACVIVILTVANNKSINDNSSTNGIRLDDSPTIQTTYAPTQTPTSTPTTSDVGSLQLIAKSLLMPRTSDDDGRSSSVSSLSSSQGLNIHDTFDLYMSTDATSTQQLAYEKASNWIFNEDPMKLTMQSKNFEQRFLLAYFYYHVTIEGERLIGPGEGWLSCGKPNREFNETDDCDLAVFNRDYTNDNTYYTYESGNIRWLTGYSECAWAGLFCDENDELAAIDLFAQDFTGPIPHELASISTLQFVGLSYNLFTGEIPTSFSSLGRLINVEMNDMFLTGDFPTEYLSSYALQRLNMRGNDLTGQLFDDEDPSASIGNLHSLKGLFIDNNQITGAFPSEIGQLEFLSYTRLGKNDYEPGQIPTELGRLTLLQELWLGWSSFTGNVPSELGLLTELSDLRFNNNELTGPLPDELYELTDLKWLFIEYNYLSGTLSPLISQCDELEQLRLRHNEFTGSIPTEIGLLNELLLVYFQLNKFEGPIPDEICAISSIEGIGNGSGKLGFLNADCLGDNPATPCQKYCCTSCCSRESKLCFIDRNE